MKRKCIYSFITIGGALLFAVSAILKIETPKFCTVKKMNGEKV